MPIVSSRVVCCQAIGHEATPRGRGHFLDHRPADPPEPHAQGVVMFENRCQRRLQARLLQACAGPQQRPVDLLVTTLLRGHADADAPRPFADVQRATEGRETRFAGQKTACPSTLAGR